MCVYGGGDRERDLDFSSFPSQAILVCFSGDTVHDPAAISIRSGNLVYWGNSLIRKRPLPRTTVGH